MNVGTVLAVLRALADLLRFIAGIRQQRAENTVETERGKAAAADDAELKKEVDKWTA